MTSLWLRRAYDTPGRSDGRGVLVDRLWPRGISKDALKLDDWAKDIAPRDALRDWVANATIIAVEVVRKSADQVGFAVQPRRWVVERFFAWINRNRRLAKDFEATIDSARAFLNAVSIMLLVRRLARAS